MHRVTDLSDVPTGGHIRHEYSRRQAYNFNSSLRLAQNSRGWLYDANTNVRLHAGNNTDNSEDHGALQGLAGDCEPFGILPILTFCGTLSIEVLFIMRRTSSLV